MLISDGGGGRGRPVVTNVNATRPQPAVDNGQQAAAAAAAAAAERAREARRQAEALAARIRELQRQAAEARRRAIEAQQKAALARQAAEAAREKAEKSKLAADEGQAAASRQAQTLADARLKKETSEVQLKEKELALANAQLARNEEAQKRPDGRPTAKTGDPVKAAQGEVDAAKRTSKLSTDYLDFQEKETKAQAAEAKVAGLTPAPGRPWSTVPAADREALGAAQTDAEALREDADAAKTTFTNGVGADAPLDFFGPPPVTPAGQPAAQGPGVTPVAADPLHSPLQQFLQLTPPVSTTPGSVPLFTPAFHPTRGPAVTPGTTETLNSIADGKTVEQVAQARGMTVDQVVAEARASGVTLQSSALDPETAQSSVTVQRGGATLVYTRDGQADSLSVKATFADPKAAGGMRTVEATRDKDGRFLQTVKDDKTGDTTTHTIDPNAGTRTDTVVKKDGTRTETTTDLTGASVKRAVAPGEDYLDVAKAAGLTPEQLLALNPDVDYGKPLQPGQQMVVSGVRTTTKVTERDGTQLERTVESNGTIHATATAKDGRKITLMGEAPPDDSDAAKIRKGLFEDNKSVADLARQMGITEEEVLTKLPEGSVTVTKPTSDNGDVETRTIYDPVTNRVLVESHDWQHDGTTRQVIDDKTTFKVRQYNAETQQYDMKDVAGGVGYLQKLADDQRGQVADINQQISDLDKAILQYGRMHEPTTDLRAQRDQLIAQRDNAHGEAEIAQGRATAGLLKHQQVQLDKIAADAYQRQFVARPGSEEQKEATKALDDILALTDKVDRLVKSGDKDVSFLVADLDRKQKHDAKVGADEKLQAAFQKWKDEVWMWQGVDDETAQTLKDEGLRPHSRYFSSTEEENEFAWEAFTYQQESWEKYGTEGLSGTELAARNAWVGRNEAGTAELAANDVYYEASKAKGGADANVVQGDIDRLQVKKDAWVAAHPKDFSENFPAVKGEHGGQAELDELLDQRTKLDIGVVLDGKADTYNDHLKGLSVAVREDPEKLKEADQKYGEEHAKEIDEDDQRINDLQMAALIRRADVSEAYMAQWRKDNPALQAKLDALSTENVSGERQRENLVIERLDLLDSSHEYQQLKSALALQSDTRYKLTQISESDVERVQKDLDGIDKTVEGQTFLRHVFSDTAEDAQEWTQDQRDQAETLRDDLASGAISAADYARKREALMDRYGDESIDHAQALQDSTETWAVVDDAVRMTAAAAAGIGATILSGGNVAVGIGVGLAINQAWDTGNDVYAAANGRDIYADGHSSLLTLGARALFDQDDLTREQVMFTLKDDAVDAGHAAVSPFGVSAALRTSGLVATRLAAKHGVDLAAGQTLRWTSRAAVGAGSGTVGQAVDGLGRVGVEALDVKLDGQWGTEEGDQRMTASWKNLAVGMVAAPLTGTFSGLIPMQPGKLSALALSGQFATDGAFSLASGQVSSLWTQGRGMNQAQLIAASLQAFPGTMTNIAQHASRVTPHRAPSGTGFEPDGTPSQPTTLGTGRTWEDVANGAPALVRDHEQASQPGATVPPLRPSAEETAVLQWLTGKPARNSGTRFIVSRLGPADTIYGSNGGVRARNTDTYSTFEKASAAARKQGGAWVHRVQPDKDGVRLGVRQRVGPEEIVGAMHVNQRGDVLPIGIPNMRHAADLVHANGQPGMLNPLKAKVRGMSAPTKALAGVVTVQGSAIGTKMLGAGWVYDNVTGGPWAAWINQTRGLFTRAAYFTGKRGLENALDMASRGQTADAVRQVEIVANRRAMRGLSPQEVADKKGKAINEIQAFGQDAAKYLDGAKVAGVPEDVLEAYSLRLIPEVEIKAGRIQTVKDMPQGTLVAESTDAPALATALGDPAASPAKLAEAVDAYVAQQAGSTLTPAQRQQAGEVAGLSSDAIARLVAARDGEAGYAAARDKIHQKGNLIDMKAVQGALGSTMHMGSRVGVAFKYGALGFAANSGMSGTYNFVRHAFGSNSEGGVLKGIALSGEIVGNVPSVGINWSYLTGLLRRSKFADDSLSSPVPIAEVKGYLEKRLARMEWLQTKWWAGSERMMPSGLMARARAAVAQDKVDLDLANQNGDPAPVRNLNLSKHIVLRREQAESRVKKMRDALKDTASADYELNLRKVARSESEAAAKSMNTANDFMAIPSMFRYTAMGAGFALAGQPVLAAVTMFHGIVSNGGWLRSQQGVGTLWGRIKMAPTGLDDGNGLFGVGKRLGRAYNAGLDKIPDQRGEATANWLKKARVVGPFVKTDNVFDSLKLGTTAEDAANRRRVRLMVTGALAPTFSLAVKLLAEDDEDKPMALAGAEGVGPWNPGALHPGDPTRDHGFIRITPEFVPEALPELEPTLASVDDGDPSVRPVAWNPDGAAGTSPATPAVFIPPAGPGAERNPALAQLFNLHPQYKAAPGEGEVTLDSGDRWTTV